jgi:hypothetical protein
VTGKVHPRVAERHRARVRRILEASRCVLIRLRPRSKYPQQSFLARFADCSLTFGAIRLQRGLAAHISKKTKAWLATPPEGRFEFTFPPKHGAWQSLIEGFFAKLARSVLSPIRVVAKHQLAESPWPPSMPSTKTLSSTHGPAN